MRKIAALFMPALKIRRPMCLISLVFMLTVYLLLNLTGGVCQSECFKDGRVVYAVGNVKDKVLKNDKYSLHLSDCAVRYQNDLEFKKCIKNADSLVVYIDEQDIDDFDIGQTVEVKGLYSNFAISENEGQFNMRKYYRIHGYEAQILKGKVTKSLNNKNALRQFLYEAKERTKKLFLRYMSKENAGTLSAMVLGDKSQLDTDVKTTYQNAGIAHVLSLSGLHIAAVGMFLFYALFKAGINVLGSSIISSAIMVMYGVMTGLSTSTVRALIMFFLALIAKNIGRTYDILSGVCFSVILIIFENPYYIYDTGFLMSFSSILGIGYIYPVLDGITDFRKAAKNKHTKKLLINDRYNEVRQSICISISAMLSTLPVVADSFYKIPKFSFLINLVVVPLMGVLLFLGISAGIIGNLFMGKFVFGWAVKVLLFAAEKLLIFYMFLSEKFASFSGNTWVIGKLGTLKSTVYITLIVASVVIYNAKKNSRILITLIMCSALFLVSIRQENDFEINVLSIGQGACNVIHGKDIPTIMIDGGSSDVNEVGKYRVIPNLLSQGIDKIDYIFVTHPDDDHISAIKELLSDDECGIKVNALVFSIVDESIITDFKNINVPIYSFNKGNIIAGKNYKIEAVYPSYNKNLKWENVDANNNSLVLKVTHKPTGFSALFTGDIDADTEKKILYDLESRNASGSADESANDSENGNESADGSGNVKGAGNESKITDIKNVDFMTIAHHGSKNSSCDKFLAYTNPSMCTISAGLENSYGHPHKETLEKLNDLNIPYLITYETGEVSLNVDNGRIWVESYLKQNSQHQNSVCKPPYLMYNK